MILNKNDCIKKITNPVYIHPLLNMLYVDDKIKNDECMVLPQVNKNKQEYVKHIVENEEKIIFDIDESNKIKKTVEKKVIKTDFDPVIYFSLPINSNNFLEIVFNITNLIQLEKWINSINNDNKKALDTVMDLFWINCFDKIDEDLDIFIKINQQIIYIILNKKIDIDIMTKVVNKLIKKNYGKKIKYITKIKKYLIKYI
jgi:hypothetical protein